MQGLLYRLLAVIPIDTSPLPRSGAGANGNTLVIDMFNIIFGLLAGIALISVIYGGFKYVISRGEPDKTAKAKDIILYSFIGLGVAFCAFGIVNIILKAL